MDIAIWILTLISTFLITEFTAWFNHKYIMHGPLWILHKDHHKKDHKSWFERNDLFFFFYAFLSFSFVVLWGEGFWLGLPIAKEIAEGHGGILKLSESSLLNGLCASLIIPVDS